MIKQSQAGGTGSRVFCRRRTAAAGLSGEFGWQPGCPVPPPCEAAMGVWGAQLPTLF